MSPVKKRARGQEPGTKGPENKPSGGLERHLGQEGTGDVIVNHGASWEGCLEWPGQPESAVLESCSQLVGGIRTGEMTSKFLSDPPTLLVQIKS